MEMGMKQPRQFPFQNRDASQYESFYGIDTEIRRLPISLTFCAFKSEDTLYVRELVLNRRDMARLGGHKTVLCLIGSHH